MTLSTSLRWEPGCLSLRTLHLSIGNLRGGALIGLTDLGVTTDASRLKPPPFESFVR